MELHQWKTIHHFYMPKLDRMLYMRLGQGETAFILIIIQKLLPLSCLVYSVKIKKLQYCISISMFMYGPTSKYDVYQFGKTQVTLVGPQFTLVCPWFTLLCPQFTLVCPQFNLVGPQLTLVRPQFTLVGPQFSIVCPSKYQNNRLGQLGTCT